MTHHYSAKDENGTELLLQTYPSNGQIRIVVLPSDLKIPGNVYYMPWTDFAKFAPAFQKAHDEAKQNDGDREVKEFFQEMTGQTPLDDDHSRELYRKAEQWFRERQR